MEKPGVNKAVFKYIKSNQTILSVGCGAAILEEEAKNKGNYVVGLDISQENLNEAKKRIDETYKIDMNSANKLPLKKESFDVIVFADVLEHLLQPGRALEIVKPYLKKTGYVIVSVPNVANWSVRIPLLFGSFNYTESGIKNKDHLWFFTKKTAVKMLRESGYSITKVDYNTSLVNLFRESFYGKQITQNAGKGIQNQAKKSVFRRLLKYIVEAIDGSLTRLFPGLFAFQFIFVAKKD